MLYTENPIEHNLPAPKIHYSMYITRIQIKNIRSIQNLIWELHSVEEAPGWHVVLGDNGAGKSTFVRATSLSLISFREIEQTRQVWKDWINYRYIKDMAVEKFAIDYPSDKAATDALFDLHWKFQSFVAVGFDGYKGEGEVGSFREISIGPEFHNKTKTVNDISYFISFRADNIEDSTYDEYAASFGPYRRFDGPDVHQADITQSSPSLSRHLTIFDDFFALPEGLRWLQQQKFKALEGDKSANELLANIQDFVNQKGFLPYGMHLSNITSAGIEFIDGNGNEVTSRMISDGYRSVISLTLELLRHMYLLNGTQMFERNRDGEIVVNTRGVVQIDEVDAHLHPTWQKRIGFWFREHFPNIQFIVTTHSPLICQAAEKGSIFLLPRPGTEETGRMLEGAERDRLLYGDILDAYSTEAFGGGETRSPRGQEMLDRLADLNIKEVLEGLEDSEREEQEMLRAALPTSATTLPSVS